MDGYKIGEKVRVISNGDEDKGNLVGKEGVVSSFNYESGTLIIDFDGLMLGFYGDEIEDV